MLRRVTLFFFICVFNSCLVKAKDEEFILELGQNGSSAQSFPAWLRSVPLSPTFYARRDFQIFPPEASPKDLAVTLYFNEPEFGFLRVFWHSATHAEMVSPDLLEGIAMSNQRTVLLRRTLLSGPGVLSIQSSEEIFNVWRIHWQWLEAREVLLPEAGLDDAPALLLPNGPLLSEPEKLARQAAPAGDRWKGDVISAKVTEAPERIEEGVDFFLELLSIPELARLQVDLNGVPLESEVSVWVNQRRAGTLNLLVPPIFGGGYLLGKEGKAEYIGWRTGQLFLPAQLLRTGENQIVFEVQGVRTSAGTDPVALRNLTLELRYHSLENSRVKSTKTLLYPEIAQPIGKPEVFREAKDFPQNTGASLDAIDPAMRLFAE